MHITAFVVALVGVGVYAYVQHGAATALTAEVATAKADADHAHKTAAGLSAELSSTATVLAAETRPDLPINLSFRRGLLASGLVGMFRNTANKELEFSMDLDSPVTGRHTRRAVVLKPGARLEIGGLQGWAFAPGQRITLNNPLYRPLQHTVGG